MGPMNESVGAVWQEATQKRDCRSGEGGPENHASEGRGASTYRASRCGGGTDGTAGMEEEEEESLKRWRAARWQIRRGETQWRKCEGKKKNRGRDNVGCGDCSGGGRGWCRRRQSKSSITTTAGLVARKQPNAGPCLGGGGVAVGPAEGTWTVRRECSK
jgi:hypothetical protein